MDFKNNPERKLFLIVGAREDAQTQKKTNRDAQKELALHLPALALAAALAVQDRQRAVVLAEALSAKWGGEVSLSAERRTRKGHFPG